MDACPAFPRMLLAEGIQNRERTKAATRADRPQETLRFTVGNVKATTANLLG